MASLATENVRRSVLVRERLELKFIISTVVTVIFSFCGSAGGINVVYLTSHCGSNVPSGVGGLLEPESALYYRENIDCTVTLFADPDHRILLQFHRFALESSTNGVCLDKLSMFDGDTVDDPPLTPELCGRLAQLPDVVSSGPNVTFLFKTDDGGRGRGFGIYFTQFSDAPCLSGDFECNNSRCIDQSLVCNTIDMCGDWSDEGNCTAPPPEPEGLSTVVIISIGISVIFVMCAIILVCQKIVQVQHNRRMMNQLMSQVDKDIKANPYSEVSTSDIRLDAYSDMSTPEKELYGDDVGFRGKVFGRKRTAKVAPQ